MQAAKSDVSQGEPRASQALQTGLWLQVVCQDKAPSMGSGILSAWGGDGVGESLRGFQLLEDNTGPSGRPLTWPLVI